LSAEESARYPFKVDMSLICICIINCLSNSGYGLVAPFLPQELKAKGISMDIYGYIFGIYSVAFIIFSPIIGELLRRYRRRKLIFMIGLISMAVSLVAYAIIPYVVKDKTWLITNFIAFRFLQGFASSAI
jgi:MFS family permease